jgi:hypothetical protein
MHQGARERPGISVALRAEVEGILRGLAGVVEASMLQPAVLQEAIRLETDYERSSAVPVRNIGVALMARRAACFAVLKDGFFRPPPTPTVFLVEEGGPRGSPHALEVGGELYTVVGEEVMPGQAESAEPMVRIEESFVIFPDRRRDPHRPCFFLLPPIPFPELERRGEGLGIGEVISVSPSLAADAHLRTSLGYPATNALATLLVGFNVAAP